MSEKTDSSRIGEFIRRISKRELTIQSLESTVSYRPDWRYIYTRFDYQPTCQISEKKYNCFKFVVNFIYKYSGRTQLRLKFSRWYLYRRWKCRKRCKNFLDNRQLYQEYKYL